MDLNLAGKSVIVNGRRLEHRPRHQL